MQVKIFGPEYSLTSVEKHVNRWLEENKDKKAVDIKVIDEGNGNRFSVMIVYEE